MNRQAVVSLWEQHRDAEWPQRSGPLEGQLMTLDTVISGCAVHYLDSSEGLDDQRLGILQDCLSDLDSVLGQLPPDTSSYFRRLRSLAELLLASSRS